MRWVSRAVAIVAAICGLRQATGAPFDLDSDEFPIIMYAVSQSSRGGTAMQRLRDMGITHVHQYGLGASIDPASLATASNWFNAAEANGLGAVANLQGAQWVAAEDVESMRTYVRAFKNHPALAMWYLFDEPTLHDASVSDLQPFYAMLKDESPDVPVTICHCWAGSWWGYESVQDIWLGDSYSVRYDEFPDANISSTTAFIRGGLNNSAYAIPVLQCYRYTGGIRFPNTVELRNWCYASMAMGVRGLAWYSYYRSYANSGQDGEPDSWDWMDNTFEPMIRNVRQFADAVTPAHEPDPLLDGEDADSCFLAVWARGSDRWVVLANNRNYARSVSLSMYGRISDADLWPLAGTRVVANARIRSGTLQSITLDPWETFVWKAVPVGNPVTPPTVQFRQVASANGENVTAPNIEVYLSHASIFPATVAYAVTGGSAANPADYTLASGTLTFPVGATSLNITPSIVNDNIDEVGETIIVGLSSPNAYCSLGSTTVHTYTIQDNDAAPTVKYSTSAYSHAESASDTITVQLSAVSGKQVKVNYATANGTATAGQDYTSSTGTLIWNAGDTANKTFTVPITPDTKDEYDETVTLSLNTYVNCGVGTPSTAVLTITDNDAAPTVKYSTSAYSHAESASDTITVQLSAVSGKQVKVNYATANGTATAGQDYTISTGTLIWNAGDTANKTFAVPITPDSKDEYDETVTLSLNTYVNCGVGLPSTAVLTITDNDAAPTVKYSTSAYSHAESASDTITVQLSAASAKQVKVNYATSNGTAMAGQDYTTATGTLTFVPDDVSETFSVPILGDNIDENNETVALSFSAYVNCGVGSPSTATLTITDNDNPPTAAYSVSTYSTAESGSKAITVQLSLQSGKTVQIGYQTDDGTASAGSDYTDSDGPLVFEPGQTGQAFSIPITGDFICEDDETITLLLHTYVNCWTGTPQAATLTITDNDPLPEVGFYGTYGTTEGAVSEIIADVRLTWASGLPITVNYETLSGTATGGEDYDTTIGMLTFDPGATNLTFPVRIVNDTKDEWAESFDLTLATPSNAMIAGAGTNTVTIADNDPFPTVSFDTAKTLRATEYPVASGDFTSTTYDLTLGQDLADNYVILVRGARADGNLSEPDCDYVRVDRVPGGKGDLADSGAADRIRLSRFVAQADWAGVVTVVECLGDTTASGFTLLDVMETTFNDTATNGTDTASTVWSDIDHVVLFGGYNGGGAEFLEDARRDDNGTESDACSIWMRLFPSGVDTLNWQRRLANGATNLESGVMTTFVVEWGSEWTVQHAVVMGTNGGVGDAAGQYNTVGISSVARSNTWVWGTGYATDAGIGQGAQGTLITLGDGVNQNATESLVAVGSLFQSFRAFDVYTMTHTGARVDHRFRPYAELDMSGYGCLQPADYARAGQRFAWVYNGTTGGGAGHPRATFWAKYTQAAEITIQRGDNVNATVTWCQGIDLADVTYTVGAYQLLESAGSAALTVTLSEPSKKTVQVHYETVDGGAAAGADYTATSGSLVWSGGAFGAQTITVPILNDGIDENDESFLVDCTSTVYCAISGTDPRTVTIIDDDDPPIVQFRVASSSGIENLAVDIAVYLNRESAFTGTVTYVATDGTASSPDEYTLAAGTLTFLPGMTNLTITPSVVDDGVDEPDEMFSVALSGENAYCTLGVTTTHTYTITDNDDPPIVQFLLGSSSGDESVGVHTIDVCLHQESAFTATVAYAASSGVATSPADYTLAAGMLTFLPGMTHLSLISPSIVEDGIDESDEAFDIVLSGVNVYCELGATSLHTCTILDNDDPPVVQFRLPASQNEESVVAPSVGVYLSQESAFTATVVYAAADVTATNPDDYTLPAGTLTFVPGATNLVITPVIVDDLIEESDEDLAIALSGVTTYCSLGDTTTHTVTIQDDDTPPNVQFRQAASENDESVGISTIAVYLTQESVFTATVAYAAIDITAVSPADYTLAEGTLTFLPGTTNLSLITPSVVDDGLNEPDEAFDIVLSGANVYCRLGGATTHAYTIQDNDALPTVSFDAAKTFRVTEYFLTTGDFSLTTYDLILDQDLVDDYFVLVRGSRTDDGSSHPDNDYARVDAVPGGKGELAASGGANVIRLSRHVADVTWEGVVTVVECLGDKTAGGFTLLDIVQTSFNDTDTTGTDSSAAWNDIDQVTLFGGYRGGGAEFSEDASRYDNWTDTDACSVFMRLYPSSTGTLNWQRQLAAGATNLESGVMSTFVVEWGSEWTVQRVLVSGSNGGDGVDQVGHYTTASILSVVRENTWVWGTGTHADGGVGDCAEACIVTLGDGVTQNATETSVAVGSEYTDAYSFDVVVMTHSGLRVDHRFKLDGDQYVLDLTVPVDHARGQKFAWSYNTADNTIAAFPRSTFWTRYTDDAEITLSRGNDGQTFCAWVQGIDLADLTYPPASYQVAESAGSVALTVTLSEPSAREVTVNYDTAPVTATAGADYTAGNGTLTWAAGESGARAITVVIAEDGIDETDETFSVDLSGQVNCTAFGTSSRSVTIIDDDDLPFVQFRQASSSNGEDVGSPAIAVYLSGESVFTATVDYTVTDVVAASPADYTLADGTLTFLPGVTNLTLAPSIVDDGLSESDEDFDVDLSGANAYCSLGGVTTHTYTIQDNERLPAVSFDAAKTFRVAEYFLTTGDFSGTAYDLMLDQDLAADYFILVRGSRTDDGSSHPDNDYARVAAVPGAKGELAASSGANVIRLSRHAADVTWEGVVTVVECLGDKTAGGFTLLDIVQTSFNDADTSGTDSSAAWTDIDQVTLFGGYRGGGAEFSEDASRYDNWTDTDACSLFMRLYPSATGTLNWQRQLATGATNLESGVMSTFVVEWGSEWTVQRVPVSGSNGGDGVDQAGHYTTAPISAVTRRNTWVWGTGYHVDGGVGDCAEACIVTLGDGVNQHATETSVAVGSEYTDAYSFDVVVMTHGGLRVDHRFKPDGDQYVLDLAVPVDAAGTQKFAWSYNTADNTIAAFPRSTFWSRYTAAAEITLSRGNDGQEFCAWVQGIDLTDLEYTPVSYEVAESAGSAALSVTLLEASGQEVTVDYDTAPITATAGADYAAINGTLTWAAGESGARTITVMIMEDGLDESDETCTVDLSGQVNCTISGTHSRAVTIIDNDDPPFVQFRLASSQNAESVAAPAVAVYLSQESAFVATVAYVATGVTASSPADYTLASGTLTFIPGTTNLTIVPAIVDDGLDESDETFTVDLSAPNSTCMLGATAAHTVTIQDNDDPATVWNYRKGASEASMPTWEWRRVAFDDAAWLSGTAPLGYGLPGVVTTLDDMQGKYSCVFLRRTFAVPNPALVKQIDVEADYNDGFVVWINSEEIARVNMGGTVGDAVLHTDLASGAATAAWSNTLTDAAIPLLFKGDNVMAVQAFNESVGSANLTINVRLQLLEGSSLSGAVDADADGMADQWESDHIPGGDGEPDVDGDSDEALNLDEFVGGTDPDSKSSAFRVEIVFVDGEVLVSFPTIEALGPNYEGQSRYYSLQEKPLQGGTFQTVPGYDAILGTNQTVIYTNDSVVLDKDYRGRVWLE